MGGLEALFAAVRDTIAFIGEEPMFSVVLWLVGAIFIWSGISKARHPSRAAMAMVQFGVLRTPRASAGRTLGYFEMTLGFWLLSGIAVRLSLIVAAILFVAFTVLVLKSLRKGETFTCFCFGSEDDDISKFTVMRNLLFFGVTLVLIGGAFGVDPVLGPPEFLQIVSAIAIGSIALLISKVPRLVSLNQETVQHLRILTEPE